jgi:hypothetical protein
VGGALREIRKIAGRQPFLAWFREMRQSELTVVAREDIAAQTEDEQVSDVITVAWGDKVVIAVKARMRGMETQTRRQMVEAINVVEADMRQRFPSAHWVFFEPDVR